jgi:hypothetical protein
MSCWRKIGCWKKAFSVTYSVKRIVKGLLTLRPGALCLSLFMNSFYMHKRIRRNYPVDMNKHPVAHWEEYVPAVKPGALTARFVKVGTADSIVK